MFDRRIIGALGLAGGLTLLAAQASASPILGVELKESGYTTYQTTGSSNLLTTFQSFGTFGVNAEIASLTTNPLSLDLGSLNVSTATGGTLTIVASATGLDSPIGLTNFLSQFNGALTGIGTSATLRTYLSNSNTMFGTDTLLSSLSAPSSLFSTSTTNSATTSGPFALTEVMTITASGPGALAAVGSVSQAPGLTQAPEIDARYGGAAIALLLGVMALVSDRRRRPSAMA
jgi:hypothetical protein